MIETAPVERADAVRATGARVIAVGANRQGQADLGVALRRLSDEGIRSLLVEGGGRTITSFLRAGLVMRLSVCIAPKILGDGVPAEGNLGIKDLSDALSRVTIYLDSV